MVARDLEEDPEQLSIVVLPMLRYAEAFRDYKTNDSKVIDRWKGSKVMQSVKDNDFAIVQAELDAAREAEEAE